MQTYRKSTIKVLIVSGEISSDFLGAQLMEQMQKNGNFDFFGIGGKAMLRQGLRPIADHKALAVFGFLQALTKFWHLHLLFKNIKRHVKKEKPKLAILIDSPAFNLRLMKRLRGKVKHIVQLVCPQLWAMRFYRIYTLKRNCNLLLTLFPFEAELCQHYGVKSQWIGHPLITSIPRQLQKTSPSELTDLPHYNYRVGLFPGSRKNEVHKLIEPMLLASKLFVKRKSSIGIFVSVAHQKFYAIIEKKIHKLNCQQLPIHLIDTSNHSVPLMNYCDCVVLASGTICLEAAYLEKPMIVNYAMRWFDFILGSLMLRSRFFCIINILAQKQIVVELLQNEVKANNIADELSKIHSSKVYRKTMIEGIVATKKLLGWRSGNPTRRATQAIDELLSGRN